MSSPSTSGGAEEKLIEASEPRKNPYGAFAIRGALGIAVVALLIRHYDARPVFHALGRERLSYFIGAIAVYLASQIMTSWRWHLLARMNGINGPFRETLAYYFVGMFTNLFVPGLVGGDAARALYLGRRHQRLAEAIASVVADRGIGLLAVFWFAAGAALTLRTVKLPPSVVPVTVSIGAVALAGWLTSPLLARLATNLGGRLGRLVEPLLVYLRHPAALVPAIILSLALQASLALCQYLLARGLGLETPLATFMLCVPIANVFASLPITLNGLGVREAAYLVLFGYAGLTKPDTIALGLLWFAAIMIGGSTGIYAFITTKLPVAAEETATPSPLSSAPAEAKSDADG
jgi:glycosyltransferase 2 family protein